MSKSPAEIPAEQSEPVVATYILLRNSIAMRLADFVERTGQTKRAAIEAALEMYLTAQATAQEKKAAKS